MISELSISPFLSADLWQGSVLAIGSGVKLPWKLVNYTKTVCKPFSHDLPFSVSLLLSYYYYYYYFIVINILRIAYLLLHTATGSNVICKVRIWASFFSFCCLLSIQLYVNMPNIHVLIEIWYMIVYTCIDWATCTCIFLFISFVSLKSKLWYSIVHSW